MLRLEEINLSEVIAHDYQTIIREKHLDVFGHVNNSQYMVLFEEARWEMITSRGYGLAEVLSRKIGPVILESNIRYKRELKNRENITIRTQFASGKKLLVNVKQELMKADGKIAAEAHFVVGCFDLVARKLVQPTDDWLYAVLGFKIDPSKK